MSELKIKIEEESYEAMTPAKGNVHFLPVPPTGMHSNDEVDSDDVDNESVGGFESNTYERISFRRERVHKFAVESKTNKPVMKTEEKKNGNNPPLSVTNPLCETPTLAEPASIPSIYVNNIAVTRELSDPAEASTSTLSISEPNMVTQETAAESASQNDATSATVEGECNEDEEMDSQLAQEIPVYATCQKSTKPKELEDSD